MKISIMTVMAPDLKLDKLVNIMKEAGYDGIEPAVGYNKALWNEKEEWHISTANIEEDLKNLKKLCGDKIKIVSLASSFPPKDLQYLERAFAACQSVGCPMARVGIPLYDADSSVRYKDLFNEGLKDLEKAAVLSKKYNVKSVIETHMYNIIPSASAAYRLVSNFDPAYVGVVYDAANAVVEGAENYGVDLLDKYIAHVHVKNVKWTPDPKGVPGYCSTGLWEWSWENTAKGIVNWKQVIKALRKINYSGALSFEDFEGGYRMVPVGLTTEEKIKKDYSFIKKILEEVK